MIILSISGCKENGGEEPCIVPGEVKNVELQGRFPSWANGIFSYFYDWEFNFEIVDTGVVVLSELVDDASRCDFGAAVYKNPRLEIDIDGFIVSKYPNPKRGPVDLVSNVSDEVYAGEHGKDVKECGWIKLKKGLTCSHWAIGCQIETETYDCDRNVFFDTCRNMYNTCHETANYDLQDCIYILGLEDGGRRD